MAVADVFIDLFAIIFNKFKLIWLNLEPNMIYCSVQKFCFQCGYILEMRNATLFISQILTMVYLQSKYFIWIGIPLAIIPIAAQADAIIPYMTVPWGQLFLLPLVILIEAVVLHRMLNGTFNSSLFQSFIANLGSTILGALLHLIIQGVIGEQLFHWWFDGGFSTQTVRNASIAFLFAIFLWLVSWLSETVMLARLRKLNSISTVWLASAIANLFTYTLLLALAIWYGMANSMGGVSDRVDETRNSQNIESLIKSSSEHPLVGFWKNQCTDDFGSAIEAASDGKYTIAFCGPGGCDRVESLHHIAIPNNPSFRIVDSDTIEQLPSGIQLRRCKSIK